MVSPWVYGFKELFIIKRKAAAVAVHSKTKNQKAVLISFHFTLFHFTKTALRL